MDLRYVIGIDFGSDSVRAVLLNCHDGSLLAEGESFYKRWSQKLYCNPNASIFRQHPQDYLESLEECIRQISDNIEEDVKKHIVGIGVDATASTPSPVDSCGIPLALKDSFSDTPDAMFYLWKDHSATKEAEEITKVFSSGTEVNYCRYEGPYQSEWYWAKILHCKRTNPDICKEAPTWVELADWIPSLLCGKTQPGSIYRDSGNASHKAYYNSNFGGLPARKCFSLLDPYLAQISTTFESPRPSTEAIGKLTEEWALKLGLPPGITISGSMIDAHCGAVGAGVRPGTLIKIIGTSAVDILVVEPDVIQKNQIKPTICGMGENSVIPGFIGLETGQAAFGDIFAWYKNQSLSLLKSIFDRLDYDIELKNELLQRISKEILPTLESLNLEDSYKMEVTAIDWFNGRRYPSLNEHLSGALFGLSIGTSPFEIYKALVLAVIFGAYTIFKGYKQSGIQIDRIIAVGGIPKKSPFVMQIMSDVFAMPIDVSDITQSGARGAAMSASVAAGIFGNLLEAQTQMCSSSYIRYLPNSEMHERYQTAYNNYLKYGETLEKLLMETRL